MSQLRFSCLVGLSLLFFAAAIGRSQVPKTVAEKLDQQLTLDKGIDANTPLQDALQFLGDRYDLKIVLDRQKLPNAGDARVRMSKVVHISLRLALRHLLKQANVAYEVGDNAIHVVPAMAGKRAEEVATKKQMQYTKLVQDKLRMPISLPRGIDAQTPLRDALELLSDRYEVAIPIDFAEFDRIAKGKGIEKKPVQLPPLVNVPLEKVLTKLLQQVGAEFENTEGAILVVPLRSKVSS